MVDHEHRIADVNVVVVQDAVEGPLGPRDDLARVISNRVGTAADLDDASLDRDRVAVDVVLEGFPALVLELDLADREAGDETVRTRREWLT